MFSTARTELREPVELIAETERYDATLSARPDIEPTPASREEQRKLQLLEKYELI